ncbi:MAG: folP [Frankiales bacterium]|nr:folP [Frankiales bacterium]
MLAFRGKVLPETSLVMAIVNRTPDSFFDKGRTFGLEAALARVDEVVAQGAHLVDIGGVKAAPGDEVPAAEEADRVLPVVVAVRAAHPSVVISVDTFRASVAEQVLAAGADLINDAWECPEPATYDVAAAYGAGVVCTHAGHLPPRTRPHRVAYPDVVGDVVQTLTGMAARAVAAGVPPESVLIDPGHDFGKNTRQSLQLTDRTADLVATGWPVLMALSRKDFVGEVLDLLPDDRLEGTLAATAVCAFQGARVFRTHDVVATLRVLRMVDAIRGRTEPIVNVRGLA